jgi:hypothetical protein
MARGGVCNAAFHHPVINVGFNRILAIGENWLDYWGKPVYCLAGAGFDGRFSN